MNNNTNADASAAQPAVTAADLPLTLKAKYFGSGMVVGVLVAPVVQRALSMLPKMQEMLEGLGGEGLVDKAKSMLNNDGASEAEAGYDHGHSHAGACAH